MKTATKPIKKILIGSGILTWDRYERIGDRYGTVWLQDRNSLDEKIHQGAIMHYDVIKNHTNQKGELLCEVTKTRESTHIGDLARGLFPVMPAMGQVILLGEGTLFLEEKKFPGEPAFTVVGLRPTDGREHDWLNPVALYTAHEQTVNLYFHPTK